MRRPRYIEGKFLSEWSAERWWWRRRWRLFSFLEEVRVCVRGGGACASAGESTTTIPRYRTLVVKYKYHSARANERDSGGRVGVGDWWRIRAPLLKSANWR